MRKSKQVKRKQSKPIKKYKLLYNIGLVLSFVFLKFIKPLWGQQDMWKVLIGIPKLLITKNGIVQIDNGRYITSINGWDKLEHYLRSQGYQVKILFKDCEFLYVELSVNYLRVLYIVSFFILCTQQYFYMTITGAIRIYMIVLIKY